MNLLDKNKRTDNPFKQRNISYIEDENSNECIFLNLIIKGYSKNSRSIAQSAGAVEYTDYTSAEM